MKRKKCEVCSKEFPEEEIFYISESRTKNGREQNFTKTKKSKTSDKSDKIIESKTVELCKNCLDEG